MNPVYRLQRCFWDVEKLRAESIAVKEIAYKIPYTYKGKPYGHIVALPFKEYQPELTPELTKFRSSFLETYPAIPSERGLVGWGDITTAYMWIEADYPWHTDNAVTTSQYTGKGVNCALNVLLDGAEAAVEYNINGQISSHLYESAVLNTSELHRVNPVGQRVMARISFKDKTFKEVIEGIKEWQGKNI